jgi:hypothetical protein
MDPNIQKEQFSIAYVQAVATVAGAKILRTDVDDDSIDIGLERMGGYAPKLDLQLKCTTDALPDGGDTSFVLKLKNYDDLRRPTMVPRWLVVMYVPTDAADWLSFAAPPKEVVLKHCAWWTSLAGAEEVDNTASVTVHLAYANVFTPKALKAKLDQVETLFRPL